VSRARAALLVVSLLAVMAAVLAIGLRTLDRDWDELVDRFASDWGHRVDEAAVELEGDFDGVSHDLRLASRLVEGASSTGDLVRELEAIVTIERAYHAMYVSGATPSRWPAP
jgi:hypothetical protein